MSCREYRRLFLYAFYSIIGVYVRFTLCVSVQKYDYFPNHKRFTTIFLSLATDVYARSAPY